VRCSIGIPFQRDGRHSNHWTIGKPLFPIIVLRFTLSQA
jgi:hypothetical protein